METEIVERIFRGIKRRTTSFQITISHAKPTTAVSMAATFKQLSAL
jgi:hypothetical protein